MSAPKTTGPQETLARVHIGSDEVRVILHRQPSGGLVDVRWFEPFAGPALALTPTKTGVTVPVEHLDEIIRGLQTARKLVEEEQVDGGE